MREFINIILETQSPIRPFSSGDELFWFWIKPSTKEIVHVENTHSSSALYELGLYSDDFIRRWNEQLGPDGIPDLEDDALMARAINAGWVRGRYGDHYDGSWEWNEDGESSEMALQGKQREVAMAARMIAAAGKPFHTLYVDFSTVNDSFSENTMEITGHALRGNRLEMFLKTGRIPSKMVQEKHRG